MHLSPRDLDKLLLHGAGFLAQKRLARGLRLNYPEAVALLATQLLELIRDGDRSVAELMDIGRTILGRRQGLPNGTHLVDDVQVEGTFRDGTKLVTVHDPICLEDGDLSLALHGSFLPVPDLSVFDARTIAPGTHQRAGEVHITPGEVDLYAGRTRVTIEVTSRGDRPIQVGSHYPFGQTNAALHFDRALAEGKHLDIPAGTAVRFEPGDTRTVTLVENAHSDIPKSSPTPESLAREFERESGMLPQPTEHVS